MAKGWREKVEPGVYRHHPVTCQRAKDHKPGGRCDCPWQIGVPGKGKGTRTTVTLHGVTLAEARNERRRRLAAGPLAAKVVATGGGTLDDLAGEYLRHAAAERSLATVRNYDDALRVDVLPYIGAMPVAALDAYALDAWWSNLLRTVSPTRARLARSALSAVMRQGERWKRCTNLALTLTLPPPPPTYGDDEVARVLTPEQVARLADACVLHVRVAVRLAAEAGLRRGEVIGLRWDDVDLSARRATVRRSVAQERGMAEKDENGRPGRARRVEQTTKGRRSRVVPLTAALVADLSAWWQASVMEKGNAADGFVLPGKDGGAMGEAAPSQAVRRAMKRAGLVDDNGKPLASFHGLRHSFVTNALRAGLPLLVVSRVAGHADAAVTAKVYAHVVGVDYLDEVAEVMDALAVDPVTR